MAKYGAIIRKYYEDEIRDYGKQKFESVSPLYDLFLYESLTKGSKPKYNIRGADKADVLAVAARLMNKYNLKKVNDGVVTITSLDVSGYNPPIITNLETGELINE